MPLPIPLSSSHLESLASKYGTPFQIYDEGLIRENCQKLLASFSSRFPGFKQYFAVKALPNPAILQILVSEGCGLDCSSVSELGIAKALGVPGSDCMYTSNYTSASDLAFAFDYGAIMNLDDVSLVDSLVQVRGKCPELMSFRLNPGLGRTDSETKSNVLGGPDAKFGVPPEQIVEAYRRAQANGATRFGIHMMTGSCVLNASYWNDTIACLLKAVSQVRSELGIEFEFINIGGGLGIPYKPDQVPVDVESLAQQLQSCVESQWAKVLDEDRKTNGQSVKALVLTNSKSCPSPPRLCMENGRYMTGPFGWLVSRCEAQKKSWGQTYYGLDSCMANLMRPGMYNAYHHISVPARGDTTSGKSIVANVVGTLCENNDWFAKDRELPQGIKVGDLFVIHDTGAHSHSMGFQYNGKLRAPELLIRSIRKEDNDKRNVDLIRERETYSCLFDNTIMPNDLGKTLPKSYPYFSSLRNGGGGGGGGKGKVLTGQNSFIFAVITAAAIGTLFFLKVTPQQKI
jgi:diaminopimelate decarboxylase